MILGKFEQTTRLGMPEELWGGVLGESWVKLFNDFKFEFEFDFEFVKIFSCSIKTRFYEAGDLFNRR